MGRSTVNLTDLRCPECGHVFKQELEPEDARELAAALLLAADDRLKVGALAVPDDYERGQG